MKMICAQSGGRRPSQMKGKPSIPNSLELIKSGLSPQFIILRPRRAIQTSLRSDELQLRSSCSVACRYVGTDSFGNQRAGTTSPLYSYSPMQELSNSAGCLSWLMLSYSALLYPRSLRSLGEAHLNTPALSGGSLARTRRLSPASTLICAGWARVRLRHGVVVAAHETIFPSGRRN